MAIQRSSEKAVVFSLYPTTLEILDRALTMNEITHTLATKSVNSSVSSWKSGESSFGAKSEATEHCVYPDDSTPKSEG